MIYFISDGEYVKIGITVPHDRRVDYATGWKRLLNLQSANARTLEIVLLLEGSIAEEIEFHSRFKADWVRGEWFRYSDSIREFVKSKEFTFQRPPARDKVEVWQENFLRIFEEYEVSINSAAKMAGVTRQRLYQCLGNGSDFSKRFETLKEKVQSEFE